MEAAALAGHAGALGPHAAAHELRQAFADSQPQAGAAILAGGGGVHLAEGLEQPVHPVGRNAHASVSDGEMEDGDWRLEAGGVRSSFLLPVSNF